MIGVTLLALALRLWHLGQESLLYDEWFSLLRAGEPIGRTVRGHWLATTTPLYYLILKVFVEILGESEVALRLPSVLAGAAAVPILARIGRRLFDAKTGAVAALLLAASSFHVYHSQVARMYTLVVLLALLSMEFFAGLGGHRGRWVRIGYVVSTAALVYTHYFGGFVVLAQGVALAVGNLRDSGRRRMLSAWLAEAAAVAVLLLPWAGSLARQVSGAAEALPWIPAATLSTVVWLLGRLYGSAHLLVLLVGACVVGIVCKRAPRDWPAEAVNRWLLLSSWLLLPHLLLIGFSVLAFPLYFDRYVIVTLPAMFLGAAAGLTALQPRALRLGALALTVGLSGVSVVNTYTRVHSTQWREAIAWAAERARTDDLLMVGGAESQYYVRHNAGALAVARTAERPGDSEEWAEWLRGFSRVWYVLPIREELPEPLAREFEVRERKEFFRVTTLELQRPSLPDAGEDRAR